MLLVADVVWPVVSSTSTHRTAQIAASLGWDIPTMWVLFLALFAAYWPVNLKSSWVGLSAKVSCFDRCFESRHLQRGQLRNQSGEVWDKRNARSRPCGRSFADCFHLRLDVHFRARDSIATWRPFTSAL